MKSFIEWTGIKSTVEFWLSDLILPMHLKHSDCQVLKHHPLTVGRGYSLSQSPHSLSFPNPAFVTST